MNPKFTQVAVLKTTNDKLNFLSRILDRSKANLISEFVDNLFQVLGTYDPNLKANLEFETHIGSSLVTIYIKGSGRNRLKTGTMTPYEEMTRGFPE